MARNASFQLTILLIDILAKLPGSISCRKFAPRHPRPQLGKHFPLGQIQNCHVDREAIAQL